jgi:hypothetical protein
MNCGAPPVNTLEAHQLGVGRHIVGEDLVDLPAVGEPPALGGAQEQPRDPIGKVAAEDEQMLALQLVEQPFRRMFLQREHELQEILVGDHIFVGDA